MSERHDIQLKEAEGPRENPPNILKELSDLVQQIFPDVGDGVRGYVKGKGQAEVEKSNEIRARAITLIGQLDLDRQKLIAEDEASKRAHEATMYELVTARIQAKAEALKKVLEALKVIKDLGLEIDARVIKKLGSMALDVMEEK